MVGRLAYENPFELMKVDEIFYGDANYLKNTKLTSKHVVNNDKIRCVR